MYPIPGLYMCGDQENNLTAGYRMKTNHKKA